MKPIILNTLASASFVICAGLATAAVPSPEPGVCCSEGCQDIISCYTKISSALAQDDLSAAQKEAAALECWAVCAENQPLAAQLEKFHAADSIETARNVFKMISAAVIPLAAEAGSHYVITCPMAGADWIQTSADIANPYFGASMLTCGTVKEHVAIAE